MTSALTKSLLAALAASAMAGGALADGMPAGSMKDAPKADAGRTFAYSWNLGVTSDYPKSGGWLPSSALSGSDFQL